MTDPKQEIFEILYQFKGDEFILDVGCGWDYQNRMEASNLKIPKDYFGLDWLFNWDWYEMTPQDYDIIIANDIFPNVDQRLELFLEKYLPHCKEMRLSLTYFDEPKWYQAKRVDGDEVLTMLQWTEKQVLDVLWKQFGAKLQNYQGTFPNGRKVLLVWLKGGLA